jgi:hypothetical protein
MCDTPSPTGTTTRVQYTRTASRVMRANSALVSYDVRHSARIISIQATRRGLVLSVFAWHLRPISKRLYLRSATIEVKFEFEMGIATRRVLPAATAQELDALVCLISNERPVPAAFHETFVGSKQAEMSPVHARHAFTNRAHTFFVNNMTRMSQFHLFGKTEIERLTEGTRKCQSASEAYHFPPRYRRERGCAEALCPMLIRQCAAEIPPP